MIGEERKITGIVLAGGKSSRMGSDKGLMLLNGIPMVAHVIHQLRPCVDELILIANKTAYAQFGDRQVPDLVKAVGPVGGIYTGLTASSTELNFFVSCDMPFITSAAIRYLINRHEDANISVASLENQMQPLFGLYSKSCLPVFSESIQKEQYKLQALVKACKHKLVAMDDLAAEHPQLFENINTPQEYSLALKHVEPWK